MVTVVLYSKENVKICEVQAFRSTSGENFNKRSYRFDVHTLADSEQLNDGVIVRAKMDNFQESVLQTL